MKMDIRPYLTHLEEITSEKLLKWKLLGCGTYTDWVTMPCLNYVALHLRKENFKLVAIYQVITNKYLKLHVKSKWGSYKSKLRRDWYIIFVSHIEMIQDIEENFKLWKYWVENFNNMRSEWIFFLECEHFLTLVKLKRFHHLVQIDDVCVDKCSRC